MFVRAEQQAASTSSGPPQSAVNQYPNEQLVFWDEFESLDLRNRWKPEISLGGFGNWEFQGYYNNRSNLYVRDGSLFIKPTLITDRVPDAMVKNGLTMDIRGTDPPSLCTADQYWGCLRSSGAGGNYLNPIQSARIRTAESFAFKYGRVEVRARLPRGDWIWPAIWLLPRSQAYGPWPASGEIDVMESRGNDPSYPPGGHNAYGSTLHVGPYSTGNMYPLFHKTYTLPSGSLADDFHVYGLKWSPFGITTYIDTPSNVVLQASFDQPMFGRGPTAPSSSGGPFYPASGIDDPWASSPNPNACPFDQEFYLIMNVAVGGTANYFPDGFGKPWSNLAEHPLNDFWDAQSLWWPTWQGEKAAMAVDYVRVWQDATGVDGSSASGPWLDHLAAAAGLPSLPPSYTQVQGSVADFTAAAGGAGATIAGKSYDATAAGAGAGSMSASACGDAGLSQQRVRIAMAMNVTRGNVGGVAQQ